MPFMYVLLYIPVMVNASVACQRLAPPAVIPATVIMFNHRCSAVSFTNLSLPAASPSINSHKSLDIIPKPNKTPQ